MCSSEKEKANPVVGLINISTGVVLAHFPTYEAPDDDILTHGSYILVQQLLNGVVIGVVGAVLIFVGYLIAATLSADLESKYLAGLIDPFGNFAFEHVTQYWTVAEKKSGQVVKDLHQMALDNGMTR